MDGGPQLRHTPVCTGNDSEDVVLGYNAAVKVFLERPF